MAASGTIAKSSDAPNKQTATMKDATSSVSTQADLKQVALNKRRFMLVWIAIGVISAIWWGLEGHWCLHRIVLIGGISLAAFMAGSLVGFLFSSHGEETDTVGKVRDWFIGGITTLTIAKAGALKGTITTFAAGPGPNAFAVAFGAAIAYAALGFFFMYFWRELYFNIDLTKSRQERSALETSKQMVEQVVKAVQVKLPADILTQGNSVSDITNSQNKQAAKALGDKLFSPDVQTFLDQAASALQEGTVLDWETISQVAYIQYYRTYFAKEEDKIAQAHCALDWIRRALLINPNHADLTTKYADMLSIIGDYQGAVNILEGMVHQPDAPLVVRQWLGYLLLYIPRRAADALKYSNEYLQLVGQDTDTLFNIACAYAQAYCEGPGAEPGLPDLQVNHDKALEFLASALQREPDYASVVLAKWTNKGESFVCFGKDPKFLELVTPKDPSASAATPAEETGGGSVNVSTGKEVVAGPTYTLRQKPSSASPDEPGTASSEEPGKK